MKHRLILILFLFVNIFAQDDTVPNDSLSNNNNQNLDEESQIEDDPSTTTQTLTSLGLDSGYKGYAWGSAPSSAISTVFSLLPSVDSTDLNQSFYQFLLHLLIL